MQLTKILNYKKHITTIIRPYIDYKIKGLTCTDSKIPNLIVSLTTYQKRIKDIKYTLYSLFTQSITPEKVILCISPETKLPAELNIFIKNGLEIEYCNDIGPYTKLIPTLKKYGEKIIVTADDDIFYPKDWLKILYEEYLLNPNYIHCHRAHKVQLLDKQLTKYETWEKHISNTPPSYFNFLTGVGGVLYPPNCFNKEVFNEHKFRKLAPNADDVWLWAMAIISDRKINVVKNNINTLITTNILTQLGENTLYSKNKQGGNDTQIKAVLEEYPNIIEKLIETSPKRLVYDASSLYVHNQKTGKRAGIYNVALNILNEFLADNTFEVILYSNYKYYYFIKELAKELNCKVIDKRTLSEKIFGLLFWSIRNYPHKLKYIVLYTLRTLDSLKLFNKQLKEKLTEADIYFSPFEGIPKEALATNLKIYQFIHDVIPLLENNKLPIYHWATNVFKNICPQVNYFTNSSYTKHDFIKYFPTLSDKNIIVAHLGYNKQSLSSNDIYDNYSIPKDKKYMLSLCAIGKRKNLKFAIKGFEVFLKKHNIEDLVFVIAGSCWANYKKEISKSFSSSNIIFTGYIDDEDIPSLYSSAIGFIYPSLYEGFGLPIIEAMAYNTPVITSNRTSLPEVAGDAAILINPSSEEDLENAIEKLYFNRDLRTHLIEQGKQRVQFFSWDNCYNIIKKELLKSE